MKLYKYTFSLLKATTKVECYECYESMGKKGVEYFLKGVGQLVSAKRTNQFKPVKKGLTLICWSFDGDKELDFKRVCRLKLIRMFFDINTKYSNLIDLLGKEIEIED